MKKLNIHVFITACLLFYLSPMVIGQISPVLVSETIVNAPGWIFPLIVTRDNNYVVAARTDDDIRQENISCFNNLGIEKWSKNIIDSLHTICIVTDNVIDLNNEEGFLITVKDSIRKYNSDGGILKMVKVPSTWNGGLNILKNSGYYFVGDQIGLVNNTHQATVYVYTNDLALVRSFTIDASERFNVWAVDNNYLYSSYFSYNDGGSTTLAKYDLFGNKLWSINYPKHQEGHFFLKGSFIYYAGPSTNISSRYYWIIEKVDTSGNKIWSTIWDGDYPSHVGIFTAIMDVIDLPSGGCVVTGFSTAPGQDTLSPNYNYLWIEPIAIAFGSDGQILWKIRTSQPRNSQNEGVFRSVKWDKENYLILAGRDIDLKNKIWKYSVPGVTAIKSEKPDIPQSFFLSQNYPNPFNPSTTISFSVPKDGFVTLKIYDLFGRVVSVPVNEELKVGTYNQKVNAGQLASGTYFYRLSVDNNSFLSATKKMTVMK